MNPTTAVAPEELVELTGDATVPELLGAVEEVAALETTAGIRKLQLAVEWVLAHPGEEVDTSIEFGMRDLQIAGEGAPTIDEGAVAEFATPSVSPPTPRSSTSVMRWSWPSGSRGSGRGWSAARSRPGRRGRSHRRR